MLKFISLFKKLTFYGKNIILYKNDLIEDILKIIINFIIIWGLNSNSLIS